MRNIGIKIYVPPNNLFNIKRYLLKVVDSKISD